MTTASWRALLFMPGDDRRKIEKAAQLPVDAVIMDLEDGVALNQKDAARTVVRAALDEVQFGSIFRFVRINPASSPFWGADLDVVLEGKPDGIVLPKVESAQQVVDVSSRLGEAEKTLNLPAQSLILLLIVESAWGVLRLSEIAGADSRVRGLVFGAEDFAGDIGAVRTPESREVLLARSSVVLHAKARGLAAIDTPFVALNDLDGLAADAREARNLGYTGKLAIHPRQIEVIQQVFTPSREEIERASRLIAAYNAHQAAGVGVFAFDGRMVDSPMLRAAETILARGRAAGIDVDAL